MKKILQTPLAPAALGPYSQGISCGSFLFLSGQLGIDLSTNALPEDIEAQTEHALHHLETLLNEAGSSRELVLKVSIFLKNIQDFPKVNEIYGRFFSAPFPARETVEVAQLPKQALIEISAIAYLKPIK